MNNKTALHEDSTAEYKYTKLNRYSDVVATVLLSVGFFVMTWIAFAMDVMTTGM